MTTTVPALEILDATLELGDGDSRVTALDHVTLSVQPGEFVAVVGPSGSGKSSLLAVSGALSNPDSGTVRVHGADLSTLSKGAAAQFRLEHIGFVFQSGNLLPSLTTGDQLRMAGRLAKRRSVDVGAVLDSVGLSHRAQHRPGQLSGGERQRSHEVVQLLAERAREAGVAVVMVTHDHDVLEHCGRVLEMVDGRLAPVGAAAV